MIVNGLKGRRGYFTLISLSFILLFFDSTMTAQTRRALLVGINNYKPKEPVKDTPCRKIEEIRDLSGCINDVNALKGILISRFYFKPENIHILMNADASRSNILNGFETHLIKETKAGDICVFYFAGHGSQVRNSQSNEPDKKDESLVPADWYRGEPDIRDKELKKLFNRILDRKAHLTAIVDACHSGSISRGMPFPMNLRALPESECSVSVPPDNEKEPSERGAIILSATQDFQNAVEKKIEKEQWYGLFTWALINVLRSIPYDTGIGDILLKVNALVQSEGLKPMIKMQDANLEALPEVQKRPLFGSKLGKDFGIVASVVEIRGKTIKLLAGYAAGIRENCELKKISDQNSQTKIKIRVEKVYGLNLCQATVIYGDEGTIKIGDLFEIYRWVAPNETRLNIFIMESDLTFNSLVGISYVASQLKNSNQIVWVDDPTEKKPTHLMFWCNTKSSWCIETSEGILIELDELPTVDGILKAILSNPVGGTIRPNFFLQLPLSSSLQRTFAPEIKYYHSSVNLLTSKQGAHYVLLGRLNGDRIEYAWIRSGLADLSLDTKRMPNKTKWIKIEEDKLSVLRSANEICKDVLRLVKIRAWMGLSSPPDKGDFPYHLALKNTKTGKIISTGPLREGEHYSFVLRAYLGKKGDEIYGRYIYIFSINSEGDGELLFPPRRLKNSENHFPALDKFQKEICLIDKKLFKIGKPFGIDTYFLLTTEEVISNPEVFDFKGVRRYPPTENRYTYLEQLLYRLGSNYRGGPPPTYTNWSIEKLSLLSVPKNK